MAIKLVLAILRGLNRLKDAILFLLWLLFKPLLLLFQFILWPISSRVFQFYLFIKREALKYFYAIKDRVISPLFGRYIIHLIIIIAAIFVLADNIKAYEAGLDNFGKKSVIYSLISGETEPEIVETAGPRFYKPRVNHYLDNQGVAKEEKVAPREEQEDSFATNLSPISVRNGVIVAPRLGPGGTPQTRSDVEIYIVKGGDTISNLADKFGISINTILWVNNLGARDYIRPGDKLIILPVSGVYHKVLRGESVVSVAKKYGVAIGDILAINKFTNADQAKVGQMLIVPGGVLRAQAVPKAPTVFKPAQQYVTPVVGLAKMIWPAAVKYVTQYFSWRHNGVDIGCPLNTPLHAIADGVVEFAGWSTGYGYNVVINHGGGLKTRLGHQNKVLVSTGEHVAQGQVVGLSGSTGWSTGPHTHFEVIKNGARVNPLSYVRP